MSKKQKIQMLKEFILVGQGHISMLSFAKRWGVPYREFEKIAYALDKDNPDYKDPAFSMSMVKQGYFKTKNGKPASGW